MSDVDMIDAAAGAQVDGMSADAPPEKQRLRVVCRISYFRKGWISESDYVQLPGSTDTAASFEFEKEDHTLGNALRWIIMKKYDRSIITS